MENALYKREDLIQVPGGKVAANLKGRLGNQMFITCAAMTYAKRTSREFVGAIKWIDDTEYPENVMKTVMRKVKLIEKDVVKNYSCFSGPLWQCNGFPNSKNENILLDSWFQDSRCIDREIAFDLFKPYESILNAINEIYGDVSNYVSVNVRRGDYLKYRNYGFKVYTADELQSIINTYFYNDKILFTSDDIKWCKQNFIGDRYIFADKEYSCSQEMDLYLATQTKANVISNGTFSWWGAYLNERQNVICPWPWFDYGKMSPMTHVIPDNWIKYRT